MTVRPGLGRHVEHDPHSRSYAAFRATQSRSVLWRHRAPILDQGQLGSCTGNALAQLLNTAKFKAARGNQYLTEHDALTLYQRATTLDNIPGSYPSMDTGSTGLAVCKAGVQLGYLSRYDHAFGFDHFTAAVQLQPVIVGTTWWDAMFTPDYRGFIRPGGSVAGGHEFLILGVNLRARYVTMLNSWGPEWGRRGRAKITFDDFQMLLADQGDVTVPIGKV